MQFRPFFFFFLSLLILNILRQENVDESQIHTASKWGDIYASAVDEEQQIDIVTGCWCEVYCLSISILTSWSDISFVVLFGACIEGVVLRDK